MTSTHVWKPGGYISSADGANTRSTPAPARECEVALLVARIASEIGVVAELRRVHEEAHDDGLVLGAGRAQERQMALVERAHRRHEPDRAGAQRRELVPRLGDRPDDSHAGTSAGSRPAMRAVASASTR